MDPPASPALVLSRSCSRSRDPDDGKVYRGKVRLIDDGKKLSVRGYVGVPMLGRSQTWIRQE